MSDEEVPMSEGRSFETRLQAVPCEPRDLRREARRLERQRGLRLVQGQVRELPPRWPDEPDGGPGRAA